MTTKAKWSHMLPWGWRWRLSVALGTMTQVERSYEPLRGWWCMLAIVAWMVGDTTRGNIIENTQDDDDLMMWDDDKGCGMTAINEGLRGMTTSRRWRGPWQDKDESTIWASGWWWETHLVPGNSSWVDRDFRRYTYHIIVNRNKKHHLACCASEHVVLAFRLIKVPNTF